VGNPLLLPLAGRDMPCYVAGVWRDYARPNGAIVMSRAPYEAWSGDTGATEGAVWIDAGVDVARLLAAIRAVFVHGEWLEILATPAVRERSLALFDRAFAITYGLEAIAVGIGLLGVSVAASATVFARRTQFGMLRHIGMTRPQVLGMLAGEGVLLSGMAVCYGLALGAGLSLVLVYVVNRQSFNWSIDLAMPWGQLLALSATLVAAASLTAVVSGRAATGQDVIRAVREDW
jgi:putative ABC transport system permease protein